MIHFSLRQILLSQPKILRRKPGIQFDYRKSGNRNTHNSFFFSFYCFIVLLFYCAGAPHPGQDSKDASNFFPQYSQTMVFGGAAKSSYSFNKKTFSDVKDLFAWLKEIPAGEKIVVKTGRGNKTITLPPRDMAQDYWQQQHPAGQPLTEPLERKEYSGFIDQTARTLFDQKKYVEAWNETKDKNPADVELLGKIASVFYYNYDEFKKAIESTRNPNMRYMRSLSGDDEMDEINPIPKAELAKKHGSAVGAYLYATMCFNRDSNRQFTSRDYTNSTFHRNLYEASKMGSADATNHLACLYEGGTVVTRHYNFALSLFKKAAESHHSLAELNIGRFYLYGWGDFRMKINKFKAEYWLRRSAEHGNQEAAKLLKTL